MPTADRPTTKQLHQNIGQGITLLVLRATGQFGEAEATEAIGVILDSLIRAALKSAIPGRQSSKQVAALQQQARQAFARALARKVKALGA